MAKERPKAIPTVYLILLRNNKILMSRRFNTGFQDGNYSFPAGHLDSVDEPCKQAIAREAKEEINVEIDLEDLELVHVSHRMQIEPTNERRINLFFMARKWRGEPKIMEPDKCDDLSWFDIDKIPSNTIPYIRQVVNCIRNKTSYSEYGW
jgi:ADP-ribose pyrophosphatase YjhB (NUDIX family)